MCSKQNIYPTIHGHFSQNKTVKLQQYCINGFHFGHSSKSLKEITILHRSSHRNESMKHTIVKLQMVLWNWSKKVLKHLKRKYSFPYLLLWQPQVVNNITVPVEILVQHEFLPRILFRYKHFLSSLSILLKNNRSSLCIQVPAMQCCHIYLSATKSE